ncbi:MAG TPA: isoleucine--tRNA ligase [Tepidisphaeraceae bacterium]
MEEKKNYKTTLNLPQTAFAMEAKLIANEPVRLKRWKESGLYEKVMAARAGGTKGKWVLHDGPPFANGDIHIGHVINKTLKDVILRFRSMQGFETPYVPGWDCHGLPIEHKIQQELGPKLREMSVLEVRRLCHEYADKYVKIQSEQFQRLGILGLWSDPYLTMSRGYEAATLEVFARFVEDGLVYKKLKPVPWSIENQTALADAELEYQDVSDQSVFVEFPISGRAGEYLLVWTTTPWTLPANLAVAVNPKTEYSFVRYRRNDEVRCAVVASPLVERVFAREGVRVEEVYKREMGEALAGTAYEHPFAEKGNRRVVLAEYVTTTDGTGLVHTAPGHGEDDFETGLREKLEVYSPVLANGRFDDSVPEWIRGKKVWEANPLIIQRLKDAKVLFAEETIKHSYPHDWRSKKPIIFRATEQWFVGVNKPYSVSGDAGQSLRQRATKVVTGQIDFVPKWGQARFAGMIDSRPDWCVSRQRAWGLPIPVFYNEKGDALLTPASVRAVAKRFAEKGSDAWFTDSPAELLGDLDPGPDFPKEKLRKEKDIFDVWFESGSSWHAVLQARKELCFPADLYLEGSDQHRGWFQLSLLPSLAVTGKPPFKQVLTHGFVVKPDGTKVSKSDKDYVTATQEINKHGADLLRLWCCSVDYQNDIPASPAAIQEFGDKYRKIRNTLRFLLSNLYDFDPNSDSTPVDTHGLDGWALNELDQLIRESQKEYDTYQLHRVFRRLHDFCAVQVSTIYSTAMKDRLYCELPNSPPRRRCQRVMYQMADALIRLLAPILVFTADEAWEHLPKKSGEGADASSVHLLRLPTFELKPSEADLKRWSLLREARDQATAQLDALKKSVGLNKALDAEIVYHINDATRKTLEECGADLEDIVGAGCHRFVSSPVDAWHVEVIDVREKYKACARSWKRRPDVGQDSEYPDLSIRDAAAVRAAAK